MKFTNVFSLGLVAASAIIATTALPITTPELFERDASALIFARSFEELDARDPFNWGGLVKSLLPIAKPFIAKIPKVGGFLSSLFRRDGGSGDDVLASLIAAEYLANQDKVVARSFDELDARDPFNWGGLIKVLKPLAKPFVAKIPKVGGFLSSFFKRDGQSDEDFLAELLAARYVHDLASRSYEELDARDPFNWGGLVKSLLPIAKPYIAKIPKVGGFLSSLFRRDGTPDDAAINAFADAVLSDLASENSNVARTFDNLVARSDDDAAWDDFLTAVAGAAGAQ